MSICLFLQFNFEHMPRKKCHRCIHHLPGAQIFKPAGIPLREMAEVRLSMDEFEAIRLAGFMGLYHEDAARTMNISRPTFGRILQSAQYKIADALTHGKAIVFDQPENHHYPCNHDTTQPPGA